MVLFLGPLLAILSKIGPAFAKAGPAVAQHAHGAALGLKSGAGYIGRGAQSLGGVAGGGGGGVDIGGALNPVGGPGGGGLTQMLTGKLKDVLGANIPGATGQVPVSGGGSSPLQGLFDALAGTKVQSTGQIGDIAQAAKVRNMGVLGKARAGAVSGLQSGLKNAAVSGIGNMGGGGQPKQAGGISFPTVPENVAISLPDLPSLDLPDRSGLAQMRQQILQEILSGGGGGMF